MSAVSKRKYRVLKNILEIDPLALDKEWMSQATNYQNCAELLAEAQFDEAEAKAELDLIRAELMQTMRSDPTKFGIKRASETAFESLLPIHKEYQLAVRELNLARLAEGKLKALVVGLDHKKKALENLVQLEGRSYFATPQPPKGAAREKVEKMHRRSARVALPD